MEIQTLQNEYEKLKCAITSNQKKYHEALILNLKKDLEIRSLKKKLKDGQFNQFNEILPQETIKKLNAIDTAENKDSHFILNVIRGLYKDDLDKLKLKSYSGRGTNKQPMSPDKVRAVDCLFSQRLQLLGEQELERKKNMGKHIKTAIENINKSNKEQ